MKIRKNAKLFAAAAVVFCLGLGGVGTYAAEENEKTEETAGTEETGTLLVGSDGKNYTLSQSCDVNERADFYVPALPGDNFDVTVEIETVPGSDKSEVFSIYFDRVTDDQTVSNVQAGQNDRSGLLNETVEVGKTESRSFSVASTDERVTISVLGNVRVRSLTVKKQAAKKAGKKPTVFTVGDSLVQTYATKYKPQTGWGQTLSEFFTSKVQFVNTAIGGRSTGNFIRQGRLNDTLLRVRPGDLVLVEFGHNDANYGNSDRYVKVEDYSELLTNYYIKAVRDRGGIPVMVTLVNPNSYKEKTGKFTPSYENYVEAMKQVAAETDTLLIDANAFMVEFGTNMNEKYGIGVTDGVFYLKALPGVFEGQYAGGVADGTHMQRYGAIRVGEFIASELAKAEIPGVSSEFVARVPVSVQPSVPEGLRKYEGTDTKNPERVTWNPSENAEFYEIQAVMLNPSEYEDEEGVWYVPYGDFKTFCFTTTCHAAYKVVLKGTKYAYRVKAINEAGESEWSEVFTSGLKVATAEEVAEKTEAKEALEKLAAEAEKAKAQKEEKETAASEEAKTEEGNDSQSEKDNVDAKEGNIRLRLWIVFGVLTAFGIFSLVYRLYYDKKRERENEE